MSKIKRLELENFMSIGEGLLEFDERGVINLCGFNNTGKSAIVRSLEVLLYNSDSTDHVRYIKDEEDYFKIRCVFDDGVELERVKQRKGASIWELRKEGKVLYSNKLETGVASTGNEVPEVIAKYLQVESDEHTGEQLNIRRNTDRLFLINTTGGDNYKILNNKLESEVLADASISLTKDKNKLQKELESAKVKRVTLEEDIRVLKVIPKEKEEELRNLKKELEVEGEKLREIGIISKDKSKLRGMRVYKEIELVDKERLEKIGIISRYKEEKEKKVYRELKEIRGKERLEELEELKELSEKRYVKIPKELGVINIERLRDIGNVKDLEKEVKVRVPKEYEIVERLRLEEISSIGKTGESVNNLGRMIKEIDKRQEWLRRKLETYREKGYKICNNCGSAIR